LTRYAAGLHDGAIEALQRHFVPAAAFEALVAHRDSWLTTDDVGTRASQRLALAALILELAAPPVIWDGVEVHGEEWYRQRQIRRDMVAFAGAILVDDEPASQVTSLRLRQTPRALGPARAEERHWFEAAFAVLRTHGFGGLIGLPVCLVGETGHTSSLVALAEARFPGQAWVQMAQASAEEHFGWRAAHLSGRLI
jgi:hypothetical protein